MQINLTSHINEKKIQRMLEKNLIKRILGPKREKVRGDWRKLHKEKLHSVGSSVNSLLLLSSNQGG
jgi:hypothetical protein